MIYNFFHRTTSLLWTALALVVTLATPGALGQVVPEARYAPPISLFATFTAAKPNFRYYGDLATYGISAGGFIQTRHVLGVEVRGSLMPTCNTCDSPHHRGG
jgi:hypothetical protein